MLVKMRKTIEKYGMIQPGDRVAVALSGGPDSVALFHGLRALAEEWGLFLIGAHMKHGFRPVEGEEDAQFCRELTASFGIPYEEEGIDGPRLVAEGGTSSQVVGREARYGFFQRVAKKHGLDKIALGHQADDQGETMMMRLLRGSGIPALGGMPPVRGPYIRPLLEVSREEILDFLKAGGWAWREDSSNVKSYYLRNRVRQDLMPRLKAENPEVLAAFTRTGTLLRDDGNLLEAMAQEAWERCQRPDGAFGREVFLALPISLQRRVLRFAYEGFSSQSLDFEHGEEALAWIAGNMQGLLQLPAKVWLKCEGERVFFTTQKPILKEDYWLEPPVPGELELPTGLLRCRWLEPGEGAIPASNGLLLDAAVVERGPLVVRNRRPGDRFYPAGLGGSKKLKDFFIDSKVAQEKRDDVPLLVQGERILWVIGWRRAQETLEMGNTKGRRLLLEWIEKPVGV